MKNNKQNTLAMITLVAAWVLDKAGKTNNNNVR